MNLILGPLWALAHHDLYGFARQQGLELMFGVTTTKMGLWYAFKGILDDRREDRDIADDLERRRLEREARQVPGLESILR